MNAVAMRLIIDGDHHCQTIDLLQETADLLLVVLPTEADSSLGMLENVPFLFHGFFNADGDNPQTEHPCRKIDEHCLVMIE